MLYMLLKINELCEKLLFVYAYIWKEHILGLQLQHRDILFMVIIPAHAS